MTRREAAMVLGVPPTAKPIKIKEAHKRIMIANHPDKGKICFVTNHMSF